jgi:eukaryotic-like serine/threonine-protein kinase
MVVPGQVSTVVPGAVLKQRYRLDGLIAVGGVGEVWRATDLRLKRDVAVKLLRPEYAQDEDCLARFRAEGHHAARLSHPNITQVYDYCEAAPPVPGFLVLELADGESLARLLAAGPMDPGLAMDIVAQVATGLQAAHAAGLVHRDIKPGNVLINRDGRVKISDFGISQVPGSSRLTQTGMLVGTPAYLAPERAIGGEGTPASDLYSLGVVAYQCLTGKAPFEGEPFAVALAHVQRAMPPLPPTVPPGIAALVGELTAKDPAARPSSAAEVALRAERLRTDPFRASPLRSGQLRSGRFGVNPLGSDPLGSDPLRSDQPRSDLPRSDQPRSDLPHSDLPRADQLGSGQYRPARSGPRSDDPAFQAVDVPAPATAAPPARDRPSGQPTAQDTGTTGRQRREQHPSRPGGSVLAALLIAAIVVAICLWALLAMHRPGPADARLPGTRPATRQARPAGATQPRPHVHPRSGSGSDGRHRSGARGRSGGRGHSRAPSPSPSPSPSVPLPLPTPLPTPPLPLLSYLEPPADPAIPAASPARPGLS